MRGGSRLHRRTSLQIWGLSPHARGKPAGAVDPAHHPGPIPACAGETSHCGPDKPAGRAYPRMRGGNCTSANAGLMSWGLSPHARGKRTAALSTLPSTARAYPRMRGGNGVIVVASRILSGLSPHARGKLEREGVPEIKDGPIPACAGETCSKR